LWPSLAFIKPEDGLCSCVRASRSWGTNASVSLRRNRGSCRTVQRGLWKIMSSRGDVHGRRGPKRFWFPVESVPGLEKVMNSGSKRRRLYPWKWLFSTWPLNFWHLTIGSLISLIKQFQVQLSPQTSNLCCLSLNFNLFLIFFISFFCLFNKIK